MADAVKLALDSDEFQAAAAAAADRLEELRYQQVLLDKALVNGQLSARAQATAYLDLGKQIQDTTRYLQAFQNTQARNTLGQFTSTGRVSAGLGGGDLDFTGGIFDASANTRALIGKGKGRGGNAVLQGARIAQDLQYGFSAILNNVIEIAPKVGAFALGVSVIANNAERAAGAIGKWRDSLDSSQQGLKDNLTRLEAFVSGLDLSKDRIAEAFAVTAEQFGFSGVAGFLRGDPAAESAKEEAQKARDDLGKIVGKEAESRKAGLLTTIKGLAGGGDAFRNILTAGVGKEQQEFLLRQFGLASGTGDEAAIEILRQRLSRAGRPDLAGGLESNRPENLKEAEGIRRRFQKAEEANVKAREKQAKDEEKAAREAERFDLTKQMADIIGQPFGEAADEMVDRMAREGIEKGDRIVRKFQDDALNEAAEKKGHELMKELAREPKVFQGFESFLASVQSSGGTQEEANRYLKELTDLAREQLRRSGEFGP